MFRTSLIGLAMLVAMPAFAQDAERPEILDALELPAAAQAVRDAGVAPDEVRVALDAAKGKDVKASEMAEVMRGESEAARERGPIDNFGAFVTSKIDEGLRGRELAEAIHAEQEARGKGKPADAGPPEGKGKPDEAGPPADKGKEKAKSGDETGASKKPEPVTVDRPDKGKAADKGAPADAGKEKSKETEGKTMERPR